MADGGWRMAGPKSIPLPPAIRHPNFRMRRDTKIVTAFLAAVPAAILGAATLCAAAIANGGSMRCRLLFRLLCHGMPSRCIDVFGVPLPICARCMGIYGGMILGLLAFWLLPI